MEDSDVVAALLEKHGRTYADEVGIRPKDAPGPPYQLLVLSVLLSGRITARVAVCAAREVFAAGLRSPKARLNASWDARVAALDGGSIMAART